MKAESRAKKAVRSVLLASVFAASHYTWAGDGQAGQAGSPTQAVRFKQNPIISPYMNRGIGDNINGPSLIKVPDWVPHPLGKYYLYFAHHRGDFIRLAYADKLEGPWTVYEPGTLKLNETVCVGHIASPDVHINVEEQEIRMYFHCPLRDQQVRQVSHVATSKDGIHFKSFSEVLGDSYFRVFLWQGYYYAMARSGVMYRSHNGLTNFEPGPNPFQSDSGSSTVRHVALTLGGNTLYVFYSRIGDTPESILLSKIELLPDWKNWKASEGTVLLTPEFEYEGADLPLVASTQGGARGRVKQLRDPGIFIDGKNIYLLYSVAGESGIAMAELRGGWQQQ